MSNIRPRLVTQSFAEYADLFEADAVDVDLLLDLDRPLLESIGGVAVGHGSVS